MTLCSIQESQGVSDNKCNKSHSATANKDAHLQHWPIPGLMNFDLEACKRVVGGQDAVIDDVGGQMQSFLQDEEYRLGKGLPNVRGFLFEGPSGTGKFHLATNIASYSGLSFKVVKLVDLFLSTAADICAKFIEAFSSDDDIIVIDNVEMVAGEAEATTDYERSIKAAFIEVYRLLGESKKTKFIFGVTSSIHLMDRSFLCGTRFGTVHRVTVSSAKQRHQILSILLEGILGYDEICRLASVTHGYTVADLESLKFEAFFRADGQKPSLEHFVSAQETVRPSLMAEYYQKLPDRYFTELVGVDEAILELTDLVIKPARNPALCELYQVGFPRGILIHGPPGSGKTHLAMALVREAGLNYIPVSATSIRSKYVGESEKALTALFKRARECAPSILLIDHLDGLVTSRGSGSTSSDGSGNRLITCFLTEMDGLASKSVADGVIVVGATDSIEKLDPAMIRPGRLGFHIAMPGSLGFEDRVRFLKSTKIPLALSEDELNRVALATEGYSGAQLDGLCREAAMKALGSDRVTIDHLNSSM